VSRAAHATSVRSHDCRIVALVIAGKRLREITETGPPLTGYPGSFLSSAVRSRDAARVGLALALAIAIVVGFGLIALIGQVARNVVDAPGGAVTAAEADA